MNEDASGKKSGGVDGGVKVPVAVAVNGSGGGGAKANGKVVGNGGQENGTAATTTTTLEKRKTTLEKRVRESSGVSSSSGECTSGESRAAADEAYGGGEDENNEAGSKDQKADEDGDLNMQPESANEDEGKQNGHFGAAIENGGGKPKLPRPSGTVECPRCNSKDTKFCYYNNYNIKQPRYFCKVRKHHKDKRKGERSPLASFLFLLHSAASSSSLSKTTREREIERKRERELGTDQNTLPCSSFHVFLFPKQSVVPEILDIWRHAEECSCGCGAEEAQVFLQESRQV